MTLSWIRERNAVWNADKARIVGRAPAGIFDTRYGKLEEGDLVPAEWWRVEDDGRTVAYGWLDVNWGDAEILLATEPEARGRGVGTFVLKHLELEARARGLNYMYNLVRPTHPHGEQLTAWLVRRGFEAARDGRLVRSVPYDA
ncbi:MAG: GNAT family N-acetyltransferase [Sandaracinaceae bacterium]|nr:GNAT family N-acetyltransferase [Sandaracinaceae bacterium]